LAYDQLHRWEKKFATHSKQTGDSQFQGIYIPVGWAGLIKALERIDTINPNVGNRFIDLGSGGGAPVIAAHISGKDAVGYDLDAELVQESHELKVRMLGFLAGLPGSSVFYKKSFLEDDVRIEEFDIAYYVLGSSHQEAELLQRMQDGSGENSYLIVSSDQQNPFPQFEFVDAIVSKNSVTTIYKRSGNASVLPHGGDKNSTTDLMRNGYEPLPVDEFFDVSMAGADQSTDAASSADNILIQEELGGIDLNPKFYESEKRGRGINIQYEFKDQLPENLNINGLVPVIINITPVTNIPMLIGLREHDEEGLISDLSSR